jgi:DNA polymerase-3 subunit delta'
MSIDDIRLLPDRQPEFHELSLQSFLSRKPALGTRRVALITNVGRLKDEVQGVLLKTLEEPHPGRVIILTAPSLNPFVVLPTVVSRCQRVAFHPVPSPEIERLLGDLNVPQERIAGLTLLSLGRPGWAVSVATDPDVIVRHQEWMRKLDELEGGPPDAALRLAAEVDQANFGWRGGDRSAEDPVLVALGSWMIRLRERMLASTKPATWARLLELAFETLGYHEQNVSPRLALECFLLEYSRST